MSSVPREPGQLTPAQAATLAVARRAQGRFERAQQAADRASDERAAAFRAALDAGMMYGQLADAFGWTRSRAESVTLGRRTGGIDDPRGER
jgi:hypothetical protein